LPHGIVLRLTVKHAGIGGTGMVRSSGT
jgi:hypothetical protein